MLYRAVLLIQRNFYSFSQGRRQKIFRGGGAIRIEPVVTTKNKSFFEIR